MDSLTAFGLTAISLMLLFYTLEHRSPWYTLAFAGACVLGSVYGFLQGAWPFGLVEAVWSIVAVRRWWLGTEASPHWSSLVSSWLRSRYNHS
jgi:hypothetical protein